MTTASRTIGRADTANAYDRLRSSLAGRLVLPGDADYESARIVMRGDIDDHPALIVRVANAADVAAAIAFAREHALDIAVRSGGHSSAGHSTVEGGLVIDMRDMKALDIDAAQRTAWAETGLNAAEVTSAAWERGLVIGFGDTGSVGIGGITLGGGVGYLVRQHGLTIDNLLAAEIVTADGSTLSVDEASHPDFFWAIRGGGGNFGVATRFQYRLHDAPGFAGGFLILPATVDTITGFIAAAEAAPESVSTILNAMNCPPMPGVPDEVVGQIVIFAMVVHIGPVEEGRRALAPFRELATPIADMTAEGSYPATMYPPEDASYRPKAIDHTFFMDHVDAQTAQTIIDHLEASDSPLRAVQLRVMGGAMARVPTDATAFAHRQRRIMAVAVNFWEGDDYPRREAWLKGMVAALDQGVPGAYVNFLRDEGEERLHAAYPGATWDRLARIKARYDPANVFHRNQNIPPAPG